MDPITQQTALATAGGGKDSLYVDDVFQTHLYEGNGSSKTITTGLDMTEGGLVWIKYRTSSSWHNELTDTERGNYQTLFSSTSGAQVNIGSGTAITSNGFTVGNRTGQNDNGGKFVSWNFRKAPGFFDIVTYTGNGSGSGQTISHNLGSVPGMIWVKRTNSSESWAVYHRSSGSNYYLKLDEDSAGWWQNKITASSSTTFQVMDNDGMINGNGDSYVAYLFAHDDQSFGKNEDESIIKCGTYSGNGNTSQSIDVGFEPQLVIIKCTSQNYDWSLFDNMRGVAPGTNRGQRLKPNDYAAESQTSIAFNSTGFELPDASSEVNASYQTYIYMAIRRPNKPPSAATEVFAIDTYGGTSPSPPTYNSGFPVDVGISRWEVGSTGNIAIGARLTMYEMLRTNLSNNYSAESAFVFDYMNGWSNSSGTSSTTYSWMFKRAPGFLDVVQYVGTSSNRTVAHNLGVAPEMWWVKSRSQGESWSCGHKDLGISSRLWLNDNGAAGNNNSYWANGGNQSATHFPLGTDGAVNGDPRTYTAFLFATLPGISKVGSYTGTGSAINVDCGFTNGARFVVIKRTDASGHWMFYDTSRGIVSGNDPYLRFNSSSAQTTDEDHIDPLSSGFTVTTHSDVNTSGGTYIFLAIA